MYRLIKYSVLTVLCIVLLLIFVMMVTTMGAVSERPLKTATPAVVSTANLASTTVVPRATPGMQPSLVASVEAPDTVVPAPAGVALSPSTTWAVVPGASLSYTHALTNTGGLTDTFVLEVASEHDWPVTLLVSGESTLSPTLRLPVHLGGGTSTSLRVSMSVPTRLMSGTLNVISGTVDLVTLTATSRLSPTVSATVVDVITVRADSQVTHTVFLPTTTKERPPSVGLGAGFGVWIFEPGVLEYDLPLIEAMGANWLRVELPWRDIEPSPGQYEWDTYDTIFRRLEETGLEPLPSVHSPPEWAAEESCGPISDTLALQGFLQLLIERYGSQVDAWEFVNEPDGREPHRYGPIIGCWGLEPEVYAEQLAIFYHQVKQHDPEALVVMGGLAYDNWKHFERDFFPNILQNGAGSFFDVVNFHYYPINRLEFPSIVDKLGEIQRIMAQYGVEDKDVWVTETGMWVNEVGNPNLDGSVERQRDFIVREQTRAFGHGIDKLFWFDPSEHVVYPNGVQRWLISDEHEPVNGYDTFQHFAAQIEGLTCTGTYEEVPTGVEAYRFVGPGRSLYILWSNTVTQTVTIPASSQAVLTDRDGVGSEVIPAQAGQVTFELGLEPVFVEVSP